MKLSSKSAIITGGSSGIGRATAIKLALEGAKVVIADVNESLGLQTVEWIRRNGGNAVYISTDVSDFSSVQRTAEFAVQTFGSLDIMFNNAGIGVYKPLLEQSFEDFDKVIKVNQYGVFNGIRVAGTIMKEMETRGVIVNTASVYSYLASENRIGYHASKAAVKAMTEAAALELAPYGIRVVAVAPGFVDTPIVKKFTQDPDMWRYLGEEMHMRRKVITPEEIANVVAFLVSDEASVINGSVVMADDGYAAFKHRAVK